VKLPMERQIPDAVAMRALGRELALAATAGDLFVLTGTLGAGKTTLVQGLAEGLGVVEWVTSPTFVLMRSYRTARGIDLVHVDAYRLQSGDRIDDLDIDPDGCITAVEWGAQVAPSLADHWIAIDINVDNEMLDLRHVTIRESS